MKMKNLFTALVSSGIAMFVLSGSAIAEETDEAMTKNEHMQHHKQMKKNKMMNRHRKHVDDRILKMDTNGDGKIDLSEYMSHAEENFKEMDTDGDQFVTPEEARQRHSQMRKRHHEERSNMRQKMNSQQDKSAEE
jgi:hypothetical protein